MKLIWDKKARKWVEKADFVPQYRVQLMSDYEAFESPITGEVIHSRGQYQAHLKHFGCHVAEPGDVAKSKQRSGPSVRESMKRALHDMGLS